jgi:hypothetical protein
MLIIFDLVLFCAYGQSTVPVEITTGNSGAGWIHRSPQDSSWSKITPQALEQSSLEIIFMSFRRPTALKDT